MQQNGDFDRQEEDEDRYSPRASDAGSVQGSVLEDDDGGPCGWWTIRPRLLQKFRTPKWALFWLCWAGALQGMVVNGFINVVITTIERRFGLRSRETGMIAGGYDVASFLCLVPVSYLGGRPGASKPRWLGWGIVIMGIGSFIFGLPHFVAGPLRELGTEKIGTCFLPDPLGNSSLSGSDECDADSGEKSFGQSGFYVKAFWFFFIGQLLHGAGASPLYTLGVTYIDENVSKKMSSVYIGIFYTMAILGPAIGFVLGGQLLSIYTDVFTADPSELGLTPDSNLWIGAWWIGFVTSAAVCALLAIPLLAFPAELPGAKAIKAERVSEAHHTSDSKEEMSSKIKELPRNLASLLSNPTFFFLNLAGSTEGLLIAGFAAFLPKLIESQFSVNASLAALLMGAVTVPAGGGGTFLGGYLVKKLNLSCAGIIKLCMTTASIAACFTLTFFLHCPNVSMAGITVGYENISSPNMSLYAPCNEDCHCSPNVFDPVCGADKILYYSPCFAGCSNESRLGDVKVYSDCKCIPQNFTDNGAVEATNQMCPSSCSLLIPFICLAFLVMLCTFMGTTPALTATLRCVQDSQRSFALGIQWIKVRLLGTAPAPLLFGIFIDQSCILWESASCGTERGSCRLYNNYLMSRYMAILAMIFKMCSVIFYTSAWWFYKPPPPKEREPEPENEMQPASTEISLVQSPSVEAVPNNGEVTARTEDSV
ncbi:solute carrier organic anion transporter family member 4A1 [Neocloeon triangulifer]|uniref:solute carrier organic anion transporter family member 4A1 n=1 Tax=Neocloeon triangulifer TaxID=2078957 RepID=UPI00286F889E|nr:solute carrier organic anion transporter family member 4A1 [Neocloeon triangulifer]